MAQNASVPNETNIGYSDYRATVDDALRFHAERFGRENYDEFDSDAPLRGRQTVRSLYRKRHKSPCVQLGPPRRRNQQIEGIRQGFNFTRNPSSNEMIDNRSLGSPQLSFSSMTGGSNASIPSMFGSNTSGSSQSIDTISSDSSSSGLRILPKDPSRSNSRNTLNDVHSLCSSTTSLEQQMDDEDSRAGEQDSHFVVPRRINGSLNASGIKVSSHYLPREILRFHLALHVIQ